MTFDRGKSMFTREMREHYEENGQSRSGSRSVFGVVPNEHRELRFMPRGERDLGKWEGHTHGVRQVVRRQGRLEPAA